MRSKFNTDAEVMEILNSSDFIAFKIDVMTHLEITPLEETYQLSKKLFQNYCDKEDKMLLTP